MAKPTFTERSHRDMGLDWSSSTCSGLPEFVKEYMLPIDYKLTPEVAMIRFDQERGVIGRCACTLNPSVRCGVRSSSRSRR